MQINQEFLLGFCTEPSAAQNQPRKLKQNVNPKWINNPVSKVALINKLNEPAIKVFLPWLVKLDPDWLTEEWIETLNSLKDITEEWLPIDDSVVPPSDILRTKFNTPERIEKLFICLKYLHSIRQKISASTRKRQFLNTYRMLTEDSPINFLPFLELKTIGHTLKPEHFAKIRLVSSEKVNEGKTLDDTTDYIYLEDEITGKAVDPQSGRAITADEIRPVTETDISYPMGNYLLRIKQILNQPSLENFDLLAIDEIKNFPEDKVIENIEIYDGELTKLKTELDKYRQKYLIEEHGKLITETNVGSKHLDVYLKLLAALSLSRKIVSLRPLIQAIEDNAALIGIDKFFPTNIATYCKKFFDQHVSYKLISKPKPKLSRQILQPDEYKLDHQDLYLGLASLVEDYKNAQVKGPLLTLFPILEFEEIGEVIPKLNKRDSQYYMGIYTRDNHPVLYFMYKWPSGKVTVIIIDSMYPSDNKTDSLKLAAEKFRKLLPGCEVAALDVTQQFNKSSDGICVLENAKDIITSLIKPGKNRFLQTTQHKILINPLSLSLNADKFLSPKKNLVYSAKASKRWHEIFKRAVNAVRFRFNTNNAEGYLLESSENKNNFTTKILDYDCKAFIHNLYNEFVSSKEYKQLLKVIDEIPLNSKALLKRYQNELLRSFSNFVNRTKCLDNSEAKDIRVRLASETFEKDMQNSIANLVMQDELIPLAHKKHLCPENIFINNLTDDAIRKKIRERHYVLLKKSNLENSEFGNLKVIKTITDKTCDAVVQTIVSEKSLLGFTNQTLTYGMLEQCVEIWNKYCRTSILGRIENFFHEPSAIRKIKKLIAYKPNLPSDNEDLLSNEAVTSLRVMLDQWEKSKLQNNLVNRIIRALDSTATLAKKEVHQASDMTLAEMEADIQSANLNQKTKNLALDVIEGLKYIQSELAKPDAENAILIDFKCAPSTLLIPGKNGRKNQLQLEAYSGSNNVRSILMNLVESVLKGYAQARIHGKGKDFFKKFSNVKSIQGKISKALQWAGKLDVLQSLDDFMDAAYHEAQDFLVSMERPLTLENILKFIVKHYKGVVCYQTNTDATGKKREKKIKITRELIKKYLMEVQNQKESKIKYERKKDLIYLFNHSHLDYFKEALVEADIETPHLGLNQLTVEGSSLLIEAARQGKSQHAIALIKKGVSIGLANSEHETVWSVAIQNNTQPLESLQIVEALFNKLPAEERNEKAKAILLQAYLADNDLVFDKVLSYLDEIDYLDQHFPELEGLTLLAAACQKKKEKLVQTLLSKIIITHQSYNQEFDLPDDQGKIYLIEIALRNGNSPLLNKLLTKMHPEQKEEVLETTIFPYFTGENPDYSTFEIALNHCENLALLNKVYGEETLLTRACSLQKTDEVNLLVDYNISIQHSSAVTFDNQLSNWKETHKNKSVSILFLYNAHFHSWHAYFLNGNLFKTIEIAKGSVFEKQLESDPNPHNMELLLKTHELFEDQDLLEDKADLSVANSGNQTPLLIAAKLGNTNIVNKLLEKNKVNGDDQPAQEAMAAAFGYKHWDTFLNICQFITDINCKKDFFETKFDEIVSSNNCLNDQNLNNWKKSGFFELLTTPPLQVNRLMQILMNASNNKQEKLAVYIVSLLKENIYKENLSSLLLLAYNDNNLKLFRAILSYVKDFDIPGLNLPLPNQENHTFLTLACKDNRQGFVDELLKHSEINIILPDNANIPLAIAVRNNNLKITKSIINAMQKKSIKTLADVIEKEDLLYETFNNNQRVMFAELLMSVNNLDMPGLNNPHPKLNNYTFLSHLANQNDPNSWYANHLLNKGLLWPEEYLLNYQFNRVYEPFLFYLDHDLNNLDTEQKSFLRTRIIQIIKTVSLKTKIELIDVLCNEVKTKGKDLAAAADVLLLIRKSIKSLQERQVNYGHSNLHHLCQLNAKEAENFEVDINTEIDLAIESDSATGMTALHYAMNNPDSMSLDHSKTLLSSPLMKECLNAKDYDDRLPLHYACLHGSIDKVLILLEAARKYQVELGGHQDRVYHYTPLHFACLSGKNDVVKTLVDRVAAIKDSINTGADIYGNLALHYVCSSVNKENKAIVKTLVSNGASCAIQNNDGNTALHVACSSGNLEVIKALFKSSTILDALFIKNSKGLLPMELLKNNPNPLEATKMKEFLKPIFLLRDKANTLALKTDVISKNKAKAINEQLLEKIIKTRPGNEVEVLSGILINEENDLFKPRRTYAGLFMASSPYDTDTADYFVKLKDQFTMG